MLRTRFAPSPTGLLHVGNALSALICQAWAEQNNAELLLRIEDIDFTRCKAQYQQYMQDDLAWLGIPFQGVVRKQSEHLNTYQEALQTLRDKQLIYPCFCTRKEVQQTLAKQEATTSYKHLNDPYSGTCRHIPHKQQQHMMLNKPFAWRMDIQKALQSLHQPISWQDEHGRTHAINITALGDLIVARKDIGISYHLAVVVDDAIQEITHVIRGQDLRSSTPIHRLLQALLNLPTPIYQHHHLLTDIQGNRLAKRNQSTTLQSLRDAGVTAYQLRDFLLREDAIWSFKHDALAKEIAQQLGSHA